MKNNRSYRRYAAQTKKARALRIYASKDNNAHMGVHVDAHGNIYVTEGRKFPTDSYWSKISNRVSRRHNNNNYDYIGRRGEYRMF